VRPDVSRTETVLLPQAFWGNETVKEVFNLLPLRMHANRAGRVRHDFFLRRTALLFVQRWLLFEALCKPIGKLFGRCALLRNAKGSS
jgi:hypothetical protein